MRRSKKVLSVAAVLVAAAPAAGAAGGRPALALVRRAPLVVRGSGFAPDELVSVQARAGNGSASARTRTTARGRLSVRFAHFAAPQCLRLVIRATGTRGDRARLVVDPPPATRGLPCRV